MASNSGINKMNDEELRIVMVGKTGIGKSATGNTILGRDCFESKFSAKSMTVDCSKGKAVVDGQKVTVIDTPGLFDTRYTLDKTKDDICQCISYASPGPHIFLVVIRLGRYTAEEMQTVQRIQEIFGQAADRYTMVLFTGGDLLEQPIEDFVNECPELQQLVARCDNQYHVFNNKLTDMKKRHAQVSELLQKIRAINQKNGGSHYTNEMFQEAERKLEEEKRRILKEKEDEIQKEKEKLVKELQKKHDEQMREINRQIQAEREREKKEREKERQRDRQQWSAERQKEMEEREREREREREDRQRELINMTNKMQEMHKKQLQEERERVQSRYETEARDEAESFNILATLEKVGEFVVDGLKGIGSAIGSFFK